jgi:sugar-phosphatase
MKAAIFDMDGLLIDSEPLWQEAEITVFGSVGVTLTRELCRETVGVRLDGVVRHWYEKSPWQGKSLETVEAQILELVSHLVMERGKPMPGVHETIDILSAAKYELAVASSSPMQLIRTALEKFGLIEYFSVLHSADAEVEGKPNPAVYLSAMSRLGVEPNNCIAFEDSAIGVRAAKSAGARVIAVPDPADASNPGFANADVVLASLADFSLDQVW